MMLSILWTSMKGRTRLQRVRAERVLDMAKALHKSKYARCIGVVGFDWEWQRIAGDRS